MNDENQEINPQPVEQPNSQPTEQTVELEDKLRAFYQISYGETRPADELWRKLAVQLETTPEATQNATTFSAASEVISTKAIYPLVTAKKSWRPFALVASLAIAVIALIAVLIISANSVSTPISYPPVLAVPDTANPFVSSNDKIKLTLGKQQIYYPDSPNESIPLSITNISSQTLYVQTCETIILQKDDSNDNWINVAPDVPCPSNGPQIYSIAPNSSTSANFVFKRTKAYTGQIFDASGTYRLNVTYYTNCKQGYNTPDGCSGKQSLASATFQIEPGPKPTANPETTSAPVTQTTTLDANSLTYPNAATLVVSNTFSVPSGFTDAYAPQLQKALAITDTLANVSNYFNRELGQAGYTVISGEDSCAVCDNADARTQWTIARQGSQFIAVTVYTSVYWQSMAYQKDFYPLITQLNTRENLVTIVAGSSLTPSATPPSLPAPTALGIDALTYPFTITTNVSETIGLKNFAPIKFGIVSNQRAFASNDDFRKVANFYNQKLTEAGYKIEVTPLSFYMGCPAYGNTTPPVNVCVPIVIGYTLKATRGTNFIYVDIEGNYYYWNNSLGRILSGVAPTDSKLTFAEVALGTITSIPATLTP